MPRALPRFFAAAVTSLGIAIGACSASSTSSSTGGGTGGVAATSSSTGTGGAFTSSSAASGGSTGAGGGCVGTSFAAEPVPLDIFVMLDQSGSMNLSAGNGMSRWESVKAAITSFVQQPATAGIGMGIQYFGLGQPSVAGCYVIECTSDADCINGCGPCNSSGVCSSQYNPDVDSCDPLDYAWADVPIQQLPGVGNFIIGSMTMHAPGTNTPTAPALEGAIHYAKVWAQKNPGHIVVVALATDGEPSECDTDPMNLDLIAAAGFGEAPSIKTFVVGVGPALQLLDGIAAAGGTTTAFHVDLDAAATSHFLDALNTIRGAALGCTYQIPPPPVGMTEDFGRVNVDYTPGDGSPQRTLPKVMDEAHCPASGDGWYYDDEAAPTEIILCDATCGVVQKDLTAKIDVVLGCLTILK
jgi:hypothetical protein